MATYDATVIEGYAKRLYKEAASTIVVYTVLGVLLGGILGSFMASVLPSGLWVGLLVGALLGLVAGNARANALRLQAQIALCQVQIERNTKR